MKTRTVIGWTILAAAALLAQADARQPTTHEGVLKGMLVQLANITKALNGVTDEDSATAAAAKDSDLSKAALELKKLRDLAETLKQPDKEEKDRLELAYRSKMDDSLKKLRTEVIRVKAIPGGDLAVQVLAVAPKKKKTP